MTAEDFIAKIVADPADDAAWAAYRDWLVTRGEPRGEIIRRELAGEPVPGRLYRDDERLLSPRLFAQWHLWGFKWRRGFIAYARLMGAMDDPPTLEAIDALFADPHIGVLSSLSIAHPISATVPLWQPLLAEPRPSIKTLEASSLGDEGAALAQLPNLDALVLEDYVRRTTTFDASAHSRFVHPRLRSLTAGPISCPHALTGAPDLAELHQLTWSLFEGQPNLTPPDEPQPPPLPEIPGFAVFTSPTSILNAPPPKLRELHLMGDAIGKPHHALTSTHVARLQSCAVLPQLRSLVIHGLFSDRVFADLLAAAPAYRHLEVIELFVYDFMGGVSPETDFATLRTELERALPDTRLEAHWDSLARAQRRAKANPDRPRSPPTHDADSRGPDGRISALGAFISGPRR